jgi:hypothetical protein
MSDRKNESATADVMMPVIVLKMTDVDLMAMTDARERNRLAIERGRQVVWVSPSITKL